tara:strand:- start:584 stop:829 length:246 start_codon:yes stop_codon:yes gene_type:complete
MFIKLKEFCRIKKEKNMTTTAENRTIKKLKGDLSSQKELVSTLLDRMNTLSDKISSVQSELAKFKTDVANDVQYLTNRVDG